MTFPSIQFIFFLVLVFTAYYVRPALRWQNWVCVLASYYFYGWWDIGFCSLLFINSTMDYWIGAWIGRTERKANRRALLVLSLVINLGLLGFFKYYNFFIKSLVVALAEIGVRGHIPTLNIVLPIGISFYTFQTLSYTIDIYRGQLKPERDFLAYLGFVSFFPQLVAGPIERASHLLPQFRRLRVFSYDQAVSGCQLMLWGFFKKIAVADNLAEVVDAAYLLPGAATGGHLALATLCFAFQIYCDFSAYSDIAAGVANLFGIQLSRNFAYPYFAHDLSEFWRRWHVSLSTWFRDYVFIPLGGSRCGRARGLLNLVVTFLLSGLWHGAAWTFVLWGGFHALCLVPRHWRGSTVRSSSPPPDFQGPSSSARLRVGSGVLRTFALVCLGWVLFRADSLANAILIYQKIATGLVTTGFYGQIIAAIGNWPRAFLALGIVLALEWICRARWNPLEQILQPTNSKLAGWALYTVLFWLTLYLGPTRIQPFIYFQF